MSFKQWKRRPSVSSFHALAPTADVLKQSNPTGRYETVSENCPAVWEDCFAIFAPIEQAIVGHQSGIRDGNPLQPPACSETSRRDQTAQPSLQIACSKLTSAQKKLNGVYHSFSLKDPASEFCLPEYVVVGASERTLSGETFGQLQTTPISLEYAYWKLMTPTSIKMNGAHHAHTLCQRSCFFLPKLSVVVGTSDAWTSRQPEATTCICRGIIKTVLDNQVNQIHCLMRKKCHHR